MSPPDTNLEAQRLFAVEVVRTLVERGHVAYWAGGCVRDQLLSRTAKDYDVATSAAPDEVRRVFGKHRTLAIGAAFGVITVLGPREAGQIEVATFREDVSYSDGRRPDAVRFCDPRQDAVRRDFTINGMFFNPLEGEVIDYVGGQQDLAAGLVRAIGNPLERFTEDKLRMLRAVRFAATFHFELEAATADAIRDMANQLTAVSAERIAAEMRRMLGHPSRARAVELLEATHLLPVVLPEVLAHADRWSEGRSVLSQLEEAELPLALAALLAAYADLGLVNQIADRWKLSNQERERAAWLVEHAGALVDAAGQPWSRLQRVLIEPGAADLVELHRARAGFARPDDADFAEGKLALPAETLNPPPLVGGNDLIRHGIPRGRWYMALLRAVRDAQLDGQVTTPQEALALAARRFAEQFESPPN